jgi:NAD(P)H-dependent FMN reductase
MPMTALQLRIGIIIRSTRPGSVGRAVGQWAYEIARDRENPVFEQLAMGDFDLPLLDEPQPAMVLDREQPISNQHTQHHTRAWSEVVATVDGYVFVVRRTTTALAAR